LRRGLYPSVSGFAAATSPFGFAKGEDLGPMILSIFREAANGEVARAAGA